MRLALVALSSIAWAVGNAQPAQSQVPPPEAVGPPAVVRKAAHKWEDLPLALRNRMTPEIETVRIRPVVSIANVDFSAGPTPQKAGANLVVYEATATAMRKTRAGALLWRARDRDVDYWCTRSEQLADVRVYCYRDGNGDNKFEEAYEVKAAADVSRLTELEIVRRSDPTVRLSYEPTDEKPFHEVVVLRSWDAQSGLVNADGFLTNGTVVFQRLIGPSLDKLQLLDRIAVGLDGSGKGALELIGGYKVDIERVDLNGNAVITVREAPRPAAEAFIDPPITRQMVVDAYNARCGCGTEPNADAPATKE